MEGLDRGCVCVCLERRLTAGHTIEEIMEMGLDKNIVEHFSGTLTLEKVING